MPIAAALRDNGIPVEIYPDTCKLKKQFDYAQRKNIPFFAINGSSEVEANVVNIKSLGSGEQRSFQKDDIRSMVGFLSGVAE